jgi:hypothetical protein
MRECRMAVPRCFKLVPIKHQKIEELTLYLIEKDKKEKEQQKEIDMIRKQINEILNNRK